MVVIVGVTAEDLHGRLYFIGNRFRPEVGLEVELSQKVPSGSSLEIFPVGLSGKSQGSPDGDHHVRHVG